MRAREDPVCYAFKKDQLCSAETRQPSTDRNNRIRQHPTVLLPDEPQSKHADRNAPDTGTEGQQSQAHPTTLHHSAHSHRNQELGVGFVLAQTALE